MPTRAELQEQVGHYLRLTPNTPSWNPHDEIFKQQEFAMLDYKGYVKQQQEKKNILDQVSTVETEHRVKDHFISSVTTLGTEEHFALDEDETQSVCGVKSGRKNGISADTLAQRLNIPIELAKRTLRVTTQLATRSTEHPSLNRQFHLNDRMLQYVHLLCDTFMDTMFSSKASGKSIRGYTCAQVFATEFGHVFVIPMATKQGKEIALAIKRYFKEIGVPMHMICDGAREQVKGDARVLCDEAGCTIVELEKGTPRANRAERYIQMLKNETRADMEKAGSPAAFWCYCIERQAKVINIVARNNVLLQGETPKTKITGKLSDISQLADFGWYEWCIYKKEGIAYPHSDKLLGRVLGPADHAGTEMSQWVLTAGGQVLPIQTLRRLTPAEMATPEIKRRQYDFDRFIKKRFGDRFKTKHVPEGEEKKVRFKDDSHPDDVIYQAHEDLYTWETEETADTDDVPNYDEYINAEVLLPKDGEHMQAAKVVGRAKDIQGNHMGKHDSNPILNTTVYDVMFPDDSVQQYAANTIAENIYSQVDVDGHRFQLMDHIMDHRTDGTVVSKEDAHFVDTKGKKQRRLTTKGHFFRIAWRDGTDSWVPLKELKETNPVDVAEFVTSKGIQDEPAFAWWVPYTLKKRDRIIAAVKARTKKKTHMYGVEIPSTVKEAYELDIQNGNDLWRKLIEKEMKNVMVAFEIMEDDDQLEPGRKPVECYMVFVCKMDFTRKARFVANGSKTPDLDTSGYAGVVSRETVRIALTYAALNGLDIMTADIQNAYLQAPTTECYYTNCGPEFGIENEGKRAKIVRALYGTKSAGRDFRNHLRDCMTMLGYESCLADPDLWMREAVDQDGTHYYEYMLLYVDDCMCVSTRPREALEEVNKYFPMKPDSIEPPKIYLGAKISKMTLENGAVAWAMSMSQYVQEAVRNVEDHLKKHGMYLVKGVDSPLAPKYSPETE